MFPKTDKEKRRIRKIIFQHYFSAFLKKWKAWRTKEKFYA